MAAPAAPTPAPLICRIRRPALALGALLSAVLTTFALSAPPAEAQAGRYRDGLFVTVPNPIRDTAIDQIQAKLKDALERQRRPLSALIFDFNPAGQPAGTSEIFSCLRLADYI